MALARKSALKRKTGLRSRFQPIGKRSVLEAEVRTNLAWAFHEAAQKPWCAACREPRAYPLHAHHLIEASFLRGEFKNVVDGYRMAAIQFDSRNQIGLCDRCHANHHAGVESPITRNHVPEGAWEFARELDALTGDERFTVRLESYR